MNPAALADLGRLAVTHPAWQNRDITGDKIPETFCNYNVATIARIYGCVSFIDGDGRPYSANQIAALIDGSSDWRQVDYSRAHEAANDGKLVVYYRAGQPHGHVAFGVPGAMQPSGAFGGPVPLVANVGPAKYTGVVKLSEAFSFANRPKAAVYDPQPFHM